MPFPILFAIPDHPDIFQDGWLRLSLADEFDLGLVMPARSKPGSPAFRWVLRQLNGRTSTGARYCVMISPFSVTVFGRAGCPAFTI
jgi:hypothetical protein